MKRESILRGQHLVVACLPQSLQRVNETNEVVFSPTVVPWDLDVLASLLRWQPNRCANQVLLLSYLTLEVTGTPVVVKKS